MLVTDLADTLDRQLPFIIAHVNLARNEYLSHQITSENSKSSTKGWGVDTPSKVFVGRLWRRGYGPMM